MILRLDSDDGIITIGSPPEIIPGIVESIKIHNSLLMENAGIQGRSGRVKIIQGWDDSNVRIHLWLIDDPQTGKTRWACLRQIAAIFNKVKDDGTPEVYTLSHPMINAWGSRKLLFADLASTEDRRKRKVFVTLEFVEFDSAPGIIQARQGAAALPNMADIAAAQERMLVSDGQRAGLGQQEARFANL